MGSVKSIFIACIVICSFLWGYHQESIVSWWREGSTETTENDDTSSKQGQGSPDTTEQPTTSPAFETQPTTPLGSPAAFPSPVPPASRPSPTASPLPSPEFPPPPEGGYQSPYERFLRENGQRTSSAANIAETMDSIRPGEVTEEQQIRRNAYFEKLSQQLQELRGEAPPEGEPDAAEQGTLPPEEEEAEFVPEYMQNAEQGRFGEGGELPLDDEFSEEEPYDDELDLIIE